MGMAASLQYSVMSVEKSGWILVRIKRGSCYPLILRMIGVIPWFDAGRLTVTNI